MHLERNRSIEASSEAAFGFYDEKFGVLIIDPYISTCGRLIAAAPDLLEALSSLASQHSESDLRADPDLHAAVKRARAAIAKATGAQA